MAQTDNERLQKLEQKISQLKAQKQAIVNREKEKERKERTRRLIQIGALAEKYLNCEGIAPEGFEAVLLELVKGRDPAAPTSSAAAVTSGKEFK